MAINVLRNVCLTRVRTVYLIRYNLPWRKITYFHFKYNILPITTLQRTICAKTLLIKEGESNMKVYRKTASIIRSDSYSSPAVAELLRGTIGTKADNRIRFYGIKGLTSCKACALLLIHNYEGRQLH